MPQNMSDLPKHADDWEDEGDWEGEDEVEAKLEAGPACARCRLTEAELGTQLKCCANCQTASYCSRQCQKADWKSHKPGCASARSAGATNATSSTASAPRATASKLNAEAEEFVPRSKSPITNVEKPYHALKAGTWLHTRPKEDVFKLLIDTYRMRLEDDYLLTGDVPNDSLYGGAPNGLRGFRKFFRLVQKKAGLLPHWWNYSMQQLCEVYGMTASNWSNLACAVEKHDIVEHYADPLMPMQLRMFGEQVYGRGPGGQSGAAMLAVRMAVEKGKLYSSHLSL